MLPLFLLLAAAMPPTVGSVVPDFTLQSLEGKATSLSSFTSQGKVALIVLRGYPGYQCPLCNRQVQDLLKNADAFKTAKTHVVLVYPGPAAKATEFLTDKTLPAHFTLLLDPEYAFTNLYGLRWDAKNETAYPSAFLLDSSGKVTYAKISTTHGGRATAMELLKPLAPQ